MKKRIKDIFRPEIFAVPPDTPAAVVTDIMREKNISCIVITEEEKPIGIFTERDIVRTIVRPDLDLVKTAIAEVMTRNPHAITPEMMLYEAFSVLTENLIRHLVVVDRDRKALGVITLSDLLDHFEYDYMEMGYTVGQIMNKGIITVDPYDSVVSAARTMARGPFSFLIVCRQLLPLGVITERDMAGFTAAGMDMENMVIEEVMSTPVHTIGVEQSAFQAAGKMHEFDIRHLVVVGDNGKAIGVVTQTDLIRGLEGKFIETLRIVAREQEEELADMRSRLAGQTLRLDAILNSAIDVGIVITDRDLQVTHLTPSAEFILDITAAEVLGKDIRTLVEHRNVPYGRFDQALTRTRNGDTYTFTMQRRTHNVAKILQATISGIFEDKDLAGYLLLLDDITEKRVSEETMHRLAYFDALTGLANRSMFSDRLKSELARARRNDTQFSIILLDVDNFRSINTTLGQQAGDRLLKEIAGRLDSTLRESDTIARFGNDEFCILLTGTGTTGEALTVAGKIVKTLSTPYELAGTATTVNFSLGVVVYPVHGEDQETLQRNAGAAMNRAKTEGKTNGESNIVLA